MKVVEAFSGIGSQAKALKQISRQNNIQHKIVNTIEWDINAIYAYDIIHNGKQIIPKDIEILTKEQLVNELSKFQLSVDGSTPATINNLKRLSKELLQSILYAIRRTNNLVSIKKVKANMLPNDIDIFTYSFPCQDLSLSGYFHGDSGGISRNAQNSSSMLWEVERILQEFHEEKPNAKPQILIMENVVSIKSKKHIGNFKEWVQSLEKLGYVSEDYDINAFDLGIPQVRKRTFMISVNFQGDEELKSVLKKRLESSNLHNPENIKGIKHRSLDEFLRLDYDKNEVYFNEALEQIPNNTSSRRKIKRLNPMVYDGKNYTKKNFRTLTTRQDRHPNSGLIGIDKKTFKIEETEKAGFRYLTPRESFLLMGFEEKDFDRLISNNLHSTPSQIFLTKAKLTKLAGNSIVVDAIREVFKEAIEIKEIIEQYKKKKQR